MIELPPIPDEIQSWIGKSIIEGEGGFSVQKAYIFETCAATENANPLFWDEDVAREITGGRIAPPSMLSVWMRPHHWAPGRSEPYVQLQLHFKLKEALELPEGIIARNGITFGEPVRMGDRIRCSEKLRNISEPKTTKLGTGRFWVVDVECFNQRDEFVAREWYNCYAYRRR